MSLALKPLIPAVRMAGKLGMAGAAVRAKHTLPDLSYDFGALEPAISGRIMELHYTKHHATYVAGLNAAEEKIAEATSKGDVKTAIATKNLLNFHGGGHLNHTLFWENLAPKSSGGGEPPSGQLAKIIEQKWGGYDAFKKDFNASLAGIQGSGWSWLVKDAQTGEVRIVTRANQDPVVGSEIPLLGVDAWEHAYYLQYENRKAEYFSAIWDVINWKTAEKRFGA